MPKVWCQGGGQEIEIPAGIKDGDRFDCPNGAGLTLRASERDVRWTVTEVKRASCAVGGEVVFLPDDVQPGDIIECHSVRQRVTYEYGVYALEKVREGPCGWLRPSGSGFSWLRQPTSRPGVSQPNCRASG